MTKKTFFIYFSISIFVCLLFTIFHFKNNHIKSNEIILKTNNEVFKNKLLPLPKGGVFAEPIPLPKGKVEPRPMPYNQYDPDHSKNNHIITI